jgi:DNA-directed RNA polymerase specialized sigma24 family protein
MTMQVESRSLRKREREREAGMGTLDATPPPSRVPGMTVEGELRSQDWSRIRRQLSDVAWRITGRRSWEHAEDLAQQAIADAYARIDGWDPAKEPLIRNLIRRVWGLATNSWRRKRNSFEVAMDVAFKSHEGEDDDEDDHEPDVASGDDGADDVLDRRRIAASYREGISQRLLGDEAAMAVIELLIDGVTNRAEQAARSGLLLAQVAAARRRVFYHAEQVSKELGLALDSEDANESEVEVSA